MSFQASVWAFKQRVGDAASKILLIAIANYADDEGKCWPSQKRLCFDTEIPERTLRRRLNGLAEKGFIRIEHRQNPDGTRTTSMIYLLATGQSDLSTIGQNGGSPSAKNGGQPSATWVAGQESSVNSKEESSYVGKKAKKELAYTAEFETEVWGPYPRKRNTSKANAFKKWTALSPDQQQQLKTSIPVFAVSMRSTEEQYVPHLEFFISRRIFETVSIMPASPKAEATPAQFDRQTWENLGRLYESSMNWHRNWGPQPGSPGCLMPLDLQKRLEIVNPWLTQH